MHHRLARPSFRRGAAVIKHCQRFSVVSVSVVASMRSRDGEPTREVEWEMRFWENLFSLAADLRWLEVCRIAHTSPQRTASLFRG